MDIDDGSIDSSRVNSVLRKWINAMEETESTFALTAPLLKLKRLERFRVEASKSEMEERKMIRPWNYSDFLERLSTFTSMRWFAKPSSISALECARCGWTNEGTDMLACSFCKVQLWHYFDDFNGSRLQELLTTSHETTCGWSNNFSPVSFRHFPMTSQEKLRDEYFSRFQSNIANPYLVDIVIEIDPEMERVLNDQVDVDTTARTAAEQATAMMIKSAQSDNSSGGGSGDVNTGITAQSCSMMYLSLCGWSCADDHPTDNLTCLICSRVVRKQTTKPFNPLKEHKFYCPWAQIDTPIAAEEEDSPGWKLTIQTLISFVASSKPQKRAMVSTSHPTSSYADQAIDLPTLPADDVFKRVKTILDSSLSNIPTSSMARLSTTVDVVAIAAQVAASGVKTTAAVNKNITPSK